MERMTDNDSITFLGQLREMSTLPVPGQCPRCDSHRTTKRRLRDNGRATFTASCTACRNTWQLGPSWSLDGERLRRRARLLLSRYDAGQAKPFEDRRLRDDIRRSKLVVDLATLHAQLSREMLLGG